MMPSAVIAGLLALAVLIAVVQLWRAARRHPVKPWRIIVLMVLSGISALMLYFTLLPPTQWVPAGERIVLTAHADSVTAIPEGRRIALPEAPALMTMTRVPDVATLLRQSPDVGHLLIVGDGLPARDREAVAGRSLRFLPGAPPVGLVDFWMPETIVIGNRWQLRLRLSGITRARVELRDPSGILVDSVIPERNGDALLSDIARASGQVSYQLRVLDAAGKIRETFTVPVAVSQPQTLKLLSHSGGPGPDLKAIRRWALDAGLQLQSHIELGPGMTVRTEGADVRPATLAAQDMLIIDERAWQGFDGGQRRNIREAVGNGLGLLLRITGPLSAQTAADFRQMGLRIDAADLAESVQLAPDAAKQEWPALSRRPVRITATDGVVALAGTQGEPLMVWRSYGSGRIGVLPLSDSYRLALAGFGDAHSRIWSDLVSVLARPQAENPPTRRGNPAWPHERMVFCHLQPDAAVQAAADRQALVVETTGMNAGCAAYWPQAAGWHILTSGKMQLPFYVHAPKEGEALRRARLQTETLKLTTASPENTNTSGTPIPGSPWPWFIGWLLASSLLWWLERSRLGKDSR